MVIDGDGQRLLSRRVANDEAALLEVIAAVTTLADGGEVTWAIDLNAGGAALLITLLIAAEQRLLYIPGRTVYHAAGSYRGDGKTRQRRRDHCRSGPHAPRSAAAARR